MMKKNYYFTLLGLVPVALITLVSFSGGQPGSFSGSPGDNNATCTACHAGSANLGGSASLTGVPTTYNAAQSYTLNLAVNGSSANRYGFNIVAEDANGNKVGSWTANSNTSLRNGGTGLTHSRAGNAMSNWTMTWQAPATDVGPVEFYYTTLQANSNGSTSGDQTLTGSSGQFLTHGDVEIKQFELYPSIIEDQLNVQLIEQSFGELFLYNLAGQLVKTSLLEAETHLELSELPQGVYLAKVVTNAGSGTQKVIKN